MNVASWVFPAVFLLSTFPLARTPEIDSFFDSANRCDYLIVTPQIFSDGAVLLAQYRNGFNGDDVVAAGYVVFEKLVAQCSRPERARDTLLRESIEWAVANWETPPSYIVLLGDDSATFVPDDSSYRSRGPMPTYFSSSQSLSGGTVCTYSDDWYLPKALVSSGYSTFSTDPPLAIGRIPCERLSDFNRYLQKLQRYESQPLSPWRNKVLLAADDRFVGGNVLDEIDHAALADSTKTQCSGRFVSSLYFNDYTSIGPPEIQIPRAREHFFNLVNSGMGWTIVYAHGFPGGLTGENIITAGDAARFRNTDKPTIFFALACANGAFCVPMESSICKQFLFATEGGAVVYIANPNETNSTTEESLMAHLMRINDSLPTLSMGKLLARSKQDVCYGFTGSFEVLGDPALRMGAWVEPLRLELCGNELTCRSPNGKLSAGTLYWEIECGRTWYDSVFHTFPALQRRDSVLASGKAELVKGIGRIGIPSILQSNLLRCTAYAWNDSAESRGDMHLYNKVPRLLPPTMLCSFIREIKSDSLGKMIASGDSLLFGVVADKQVVLLRRQPSGVFTAACAFNVQGVGAVSLSHDDKAFIAIDSARYRYSDHCKSITRKVDRSGNTLWAYCDTEFYNAKGIRGVSDGGVVIWRSRDDKAGTDCIRLNASGKLIWKTRIASTVTDMAETSRGECFYTGSVDTPDDLILNRKALTAGVISLTGEVVRERSFLKGASACGNALSILPDGRWIIAGTVVIGKGNDLWLLCLNDKSDTLWSRTVENSAASSCLVTNDNEIAVGGSSQGADTTGIVVIFDQEGNGRFTLPAPGNHVRLLSQGGAAYQFHIACTNNYRERINAGMAEYVGILSGNGTGITPRFFRKTTEGFPRFDAAVLPSHGIQFTLGSPQGSEAIIDLFDLLGRRIRTIVVPPGRGHFVWNDDNYVPGTYLARLRTNAITAGAVLVHW